MSRLTALCLRVAEGMRILSIVKLVDSYFRVWVVCPDCIRFPSGCGRSRLVTKSKSYGHPIDANLIRDFHKFLHEHVDKGIKYVNPFRILSVVLGLPDSVSGEPLCGYVMMYAIPQMAMIPIAPPAITIPIAFQIVSCARSVIVCILSDQRVSHRQDRL